MAYGTVNADVIGTSVSGSNLGAGNATVFKNKLINGDFRIDQRNAGASVATTVGTGTPAYTLDRWAYASTAASKFTIQRNAGSVTPPVGFTNYLGCTSTSAYSVGSGDLFTIEQFIEGLNVQDLAWGTANAKTVTLSFWVYSSLTGTFGGSLRNGAANRSYPFSYTISSANTWQQISITIAGDTSGTWLTTNGIGLGVFFGLGAGSTFSGTAGAWNSNNNVSSTGATSVVGTNGATWYITGVQLEVGSSATGFEYMDYGRQLAQCQRYYQTGATTSFVDNATKGAGTGMYWPGPSFAVTMRASPTVSITAQPSIVNASNVSARAGTATKFDFSSSSTSSGQSVFDGTGTWTASIEL